MIKRVKTLPLVIALALLYAAVVQYNDPDSFYWIILYGSAAVLSAISAFRKPLPVLCAAVFLASLIWAVSLLPQIVEEASFTANEREREFLGLSIVAGWMMCILISAKRSEQIS